ncbi:hypothetical protein BKP35_16845 [Anaerobacillus arseniciselenatis]|uniref:Uncharacterized protein n=1 Tax=Anaerobacillus arseniciselenatis TaxID=85682 RepID=A0A1S2LA16_9BACI|nr:hypothetical protein BKP35_16845 [Anaerobacillus arseniciselenatis]
MVLKEENPLKISYEKVKYQALNFYNLYFVRGVTPRRRGRTKIQPTRWSTAFFKIYSFNSIYGFSKGEFFGVKYLEDTSVAMNIRNAF